MTRGLYGQLLFYKEDLGRGYKLGIMAREEVKLFGAWSSPYTCRVIWALKLKGVDYEYIDEDVLNLSPMVLQYNPIHNKVPVLVHDGKPIAESMVIVEYIDGIWKQNPIIPTDPYKRAMARFWANYGEEKCLPAIRHVFCADGEEREKAKVPLLKIFKTLDEELKGKRFFGGESIGFADLVMGWIPHWLGVLEEVLNSNMVDRECVPWFHAWMISFNEDPIIKENLPPRDKMISLYHTLRPIMIEASANGAQ